MTVAQENLDWAELVTVDLSTYGSPEENKKLAETLINVAYLRIRGARQLNSRRLSAEALPCPTPALAASLRQIHRFSPERFNHAGLSYDQLHSCSPAAQGTKPTIPPPAATKNPAKVIGRSWNVTGILFLFLCKQSLNYYVANTSQVRRISSDR